MFAKLSRWIQRFQGRDLKPGEMADVLEGFLNGTGGAWDWDELETVRLKDPELERIRQVYILGVNSKKPPPYEPSQYATEEGRQHLQGVIKMLRELEQRRTASQ